MIEIEQQFYLFKHLFLLPRYEVRNILAFMGVDSKKCSFTFN